MSFSEVSDVTNFISAVNCASAMSELADLLTADFTLVLAV